MAWDVREAPVAAQSADQTYTGTRRSFPLVNRPMAVRVSVRFFDPVNVDYSRTYSTSRKFQPTPEICLALLRRLDHCSDELITRNDASALEPGPGRPARFEISFQFLDAPCKTKERTFTSYQTKLPTMDQATDVILATDRMIGLFLIRHDKAFKWAKGPVREYVSGKPKTAKPAAGGAESLACVPRCRFFPSTQSYEFVPGYEIELSFNSTCSTRRPQNLSKTIHLSSSQCSPLTRSFGEEMLSAATKSINSALDSRKRALIGFRWLSAMNDTLSIDLRIRNNLGPDHDHLTYRLDTKQSLFNSPNGLDCIMFLDEVYRSLARVRDRVDDAIGATHELEVKVLELHGSRWEATDPLSIYLDSTISYSRRTVEAILERVQTGVASILHGNDNSITLSILHRGHLVLDKTLIAHEDPAIVKRPPLAMTPEQEGNIVLSKLAQRIQGDIAMVCKDTCALDSHGDALPNLRMVQKSHATRIPEPAPVEAPPQSVVPQALLETPPPSSHSNKLPRRGTIGTKDSDGPRGSNFTSSAPPRTPLNNVRRLRHEDMDLTPPPTPSLIDSEVETPRDSMVITPPPGIGRSRGLSQASSLGPRIVDDDAASVNDPIVRDFAHLASQVEPLSKDYRPERFVPISKSDHRFGGALVPESPTPVRTILIAPEPVVENLQATSSKAVTPAGEIMAKAEVLRDKTQETGKDDAIAVGDSAQDSKGAIEPVLEGWLEYRCEPLDPPKPIPEQPPSSRVDNTSSDLKASEPVLEGWLEYSCEPLEAIAEETESTDPPPFEGWLEYWCEPLEEEEEEEKGQDMLPEAVADDPGSTESPVLEGWLEYWCEPLDPEEQTPMSNPKVTPSITRDQIRGPSAPMAAEETASLLDNGQAIPSGGNTPATPRSLPSLSVENWDAESATTRCSEGAYTAMECPSKELHLEMAPPSATATVFFDAPEAVAIGAIPVATIEPVSSREDTATTEIKLDVEEPLANDLEAVPEIDDEPAAPLLGQGESVADKPSNQDQDTELPQVGDQAPTALTTSDNTDPTHGAPPTPDDEVIPGFFQGERAAKGKEVAVELEAGEPGTSSLETEGPELAQAVAEIDTAVERSHEAGQSADAAAGAQQSREVEEEIARAVADINAAVERQAAYQRTQNEKALHEKQKPVDADGGSGLGITLPGADTDSVTKELARAANDPLVGPAKTLSPAEEEELDIDRAVAEIDAAVNSRATAAKEEKARRVLEVALREKNSLEIARAIAEIDAAVERRKAEQEAKERPKLEDIPKRLERALTDTMVPPLPPRPYRRLSLAGPRPNALLLSPTSRLESFAAPPRTNSLPPPERPRTGVPFAGPSYGRSQLSRKSSLPLHVGLHNDYLFPLQDALLGTQSSTSFFGGSSSQGSQASSRASPVLSSLKAECKSGLPDPPRVAPETVPEEPPKASSAEAGAEASDKKDRVETPPATPKTGYGAFPGFMFWAAGVTIASSVFRRA